MMNGGGLFGDLPAAKNQAHSSNTFAAENPTANGNANPVAAAHLPPPSLVVPLQTKSKTKTKRTATATATTTSAVAFLPAALRKRPKPTTQSAVITTREPPPAPSTTVTGSISVHKLPPGQSSGTDADVSAQDVDRTIAETTVLNEQDDLYDPALPNDLEQYWQRQRAAQERQRLQEERRQQLADQQALQEAAAAARQALVQAGQYEAVQAQEGVSRGRGRGLSNLPAWMTQKQPQGPSEKKSHESHA